MTSRDLSQLNVNVRLVRSRFLRVLVATRVALPELLTTGALLGGWLLITLGIVLLTSPLAWLFSGGMLLLSLGGWRLLWTIVTNGLYALTRSVPKDG